MRNRTRECPCPIPIESKHHLRRNPTTDDPIIMCTKHAKLHDEGVTFTLYTETNQ